ncbi:hypothetical protein AC1031_016683 [Aphanomyces cochlioides]|nr:hypothetical protein AC1031_016683 [Aphanomyces cochlioides]
MKTFCASISVRIGSRRRKRLVLVSMRRMRHVFCINLFQWWDMHGLATKAPEQPHLVDSAVWDFEFCRQTMTAHLLFVMFGDTVTTVMSGNLLQTLPTSRAGRLRQAGHYHVFQAMIRDSSKANSSLFKRIRDTSKNSRV